MTNIQGFRLFHYETHDSTNDAAKRHAREVAIEKAVFIADQQTNGRGRSGNTWESPIGNLYMSVLMPCQVEMRHAGQFSFIAAIALHQALSPYLSEADDLRLKWPNDLLLNNKKLAGILLESEGQGMNLSWIVIGMGVNLNSAPDYAASLNGEISPIDLAQDILQHIHAWIDVYMDQGFGPVRAGWLERCAGLGNQIQARLPNQTKQGTFETIDDQGCLILNVNGKPERITSGEIFFDI